MSELKTKLRTVVAGWDFRQKLNKTYFSQFFVLLDFSTPPPPVLGSEKKWDAVLFFLVDTLECGLIGNV